MYYLNFHYALLVWLSDDWKADDVDVDSDEAMCDGPIFSGIGIGSGALPTRIDRYERVHGSCRYGRS